MSRFVPTAETMMTCDSLGEPGAMVLVLLMKSRLRGLRLFHGARAVTHD